MKLEQFQGLYDVRDASIDDVPFILSTFLRGLYYGDPRFKDTSKPIFMQNYRKIAGSLIVSPKVTVQVACLRDDPTVILGYSILSSTYETIHWVYVKKAWRNKGIARSLVPQYPTKVTHLTQVGKSLLSKFENCIFNPFLGD